MTRNGNGRRPHSTTLPPLRGSYIGSCYDITDRVERAAELEATVQDRTRTLSVTIEALEAANETRSRFLRAMSHELRTPLNSILGLSGVLLDGLAGPLTEEQVKQMTMIRQAGTSLFDLISDMLRMADVDKKVSHAVPVPLEEVLEGALSNLEGDTGRVSINQESVSGIIMNTDLRLLREREWTRVRDRPQSRPHSQWSVERIAHADRAFHPRAGPTDIGFRLITLSHLNAGGLSRERG